MTARLLQVKLEPFIVKSKGTDMDSVPFFFVINHAFLSFIGRTRKILISNATIYNAPVTYNTF